MPPKQLKTFNTAYISPCRLVPFFFDAEKRGLFAIAFYRVDNFQRQSPEHSTPSAAKISHAADDLPTSPRRAFCPGAEHIAAISKNIPALSLFPDTTSLFTHFGRYRYYAIRLILIVMSSRLRTMGNDTRVASADEAAHFDISAEILFSMQEVSPLLTTSPLYRGFIFKLSSVDAH